MRNTGIYILVIAFLSFVSGLACKGLDKKQTSLVDKNNEKLIKEYKTLKEVKEKQLFRVENCLKDQELLLQVVKDLQAGKKPTEEQLKKALLGVNRTLGALRLYKKEKYQPAALEIKIKRQEALRAMLQEALK